MLHFYFVLICFALEINYLNYGHLNVLFLHYGSLRIIFTFKPMCTVKPISFNCRHECVKQCFELARWNFLGWNSAPRWLSIIHAVRAGKRNSGTVTPGVVLYTSFLLLLTFLARGPSCYGHLASVIRQHLPHDWCSLGTTVAAVWLKTPPFLTCKTVRVMLGFVSVWVLGARKW